MENALPGVIQPLDWGFLAYRSIGIRPGHGAFTFAGASAMCGAISGSACFANLLVLGSIPVHGFCPVDLSGEPAGY